MIGKTLSHFRILAKLGAGGAGDVYRALDTRLGREVAIKVLRGFGEDPARLARFRREARVVASLNHPYVMTLHSVEEVDDRIFLVMELIEGETLHGRIQPGGLPLEELLDLAVPMAEAIEAAHELGIIHRDLKPGNVMIHRGERVKILDFGLAKNFQADGEESATTYVGTSLDDALRAAESDSGGESSDPVSMIGEVMGTAPYMSPEQATGKELDPRSDLFSYGVLLYELASGRRPFQAENPMMTLRAVQREEPEPLNLARPDLPHEICALVHDCLIKDREKRIDSASEILFRLRALRGPESTTSLPVFQPPRKSRPGAIAAGVLIPLLLLGWLFFGRGGVEEHPASFIEASPNVNVVAVLPFDVQGGDEVDFLKDGMVDLLVAKLDGVGGVRTVDPYALLSAAETEQIAIDPGGAQELARRFRADFFVLGKVIEVGDDLLLSASLYAAQNADLIRQTNTEGRRSDLFDLTDRLAADLLAAQLDESSTGFTRLAARTTESLEALKNYLEGEEAFRAGRYEEAIELLQRAVAEDAEFGLAWYRLSVAAEWATQVKIMEHAASEATLHSLRLSERHRRLLQARNSMIQGDVFGAEDLYREIVENYPEDLEAWVQLAESQSHVGHVPGHSMVRAREAWERALEIEPEFISALWHLARISAVEGAHEELRTMIERIEAQDPEGDRDLEIGALRALTLGDGEARVQAREALTRAESDIIAISAWGVVVAVDDRAEEVGELLEALTEAGRDPADQTLGGVGQAYLKLADGKPDEAFALLQKSEEILPEVVVEHEALIATLPFVAVDRERLLDIRKRLRAREMPDIEKARESFFSLINDFHEPVQQYLLGRLALALDPKAEIEREATALEKLGANTEHPGASGLADDLASGLRALRAFNEEDYERTLAELSTIRHDLIPFQIAVAGPFGSRAPERFLRAQTLLALGRDEEALPWLDSFSEVSFCDEAFHAPAMELKEEALRRLGRLVD